jgi:hypothetical protein
VPPEESKNPTQLRMLSPDDKLAEIRRLYYRTSAKTIQQDLARAVELLKSMNSEEERQRAAVYMDGLAQMRSDWTRKHRQKKPDRRT